MQPLDTLDSMRGAHTAGMKISYHSPHTGWHHGRTFLSAKSLDVRLTWMLHGTRLCGTRPGSGSTHISCDN
jgi:hypothetical protein